MSEPKPKPPASGLDRFRVLLKRGFIVLIAVALGGYGILVAARLIAKAQW
ncbi:MAG: hypothetical protein ACRECA_06015 [Pseudolabrys sp.]